MGLDLRPAAIYNGGIYMSFWNVLLVIIVILAILLVVLYILGSRMQKRQAEQQTMIDASKQTVSILAIDKKKLKIGDSGLHFLCHFLRECVIMGGTKKRKNWRK